MTFNDTNYRLTKHGRKRFIERYGKLQDREILETCLYHPQSIWKPDKIDGFRLVTFLELRSARNSETNSEKSNAFHSQRKEGSGAYSTYQDTLSSGEELLRSN